MSDLEDTLKHVEWLKEVEPALGMTANAQRLVVLADEVERLRADNLLLAMANTDREQLKAENAELRKAVNQQMDDFEAAVSRLESENAELRELVNSVDIGREVEWFRRREPLVLPAINQSHDMASEMFYRFTRANPKPGAGE
jgi:hypothetical protein